jgi:ribonuclease D
MSEGDHSFRQAHAWRSKFRSRSHDAAHEEGPAPQIQCTHERVFRGKPELVQTQEGLEKLIGRLRAAGSFAYDSEFIGELSYVPRLCLVQTATDQEITLVDPLAEIDLKPLWELMADASVEKIVHAGGQDMEPVKRNLQRPAANVVDTQIAAGFAGLPYPVSLQRLVLQMLQVRLGKGLTFTHWDQRPLSAQQLRYAADDVRYLPAAWAELRKLVEAAGTFRWAGQECEAMCLSTPYQFDPLTSFTRIRGAGSLDARQLGILRELALWRDGCARQEDLPPRTVVKDEVMIDLCRTAPGSEDRLSAIQGLPRPIRQNHAQAILDAIKLGAASPAPEAMENRKMDELPREQFRTDALHSAAQTMCMAQGIDPQIVFARTDMAEFTRAMSNGGELDKLRIMQGWRKEVVGQWLVDACRSGEATAFACPEGRLAVVKRPGAGGQA